MEALNSQTNLDDLNLNIDSFQGGLECNVDEVYIFLSFRISITAWNHENYWKNIFYATVNSTRIKY